MSDRCVYLGQTGTGLYKYCTSKKHPKYDKKDGCATFGANPPKVCYAGGKGCPVYKKESKSKR